MTASRSRPTMAGRRGCWCRISISGNRPNGSTACSSPERTSCGFWELRGYHTLRRPVARAALHRRLTPCGRRDLRWQQATITAIVQRSPTRDRASSSPRRAFRLRRRPARRRAADGAGRLPRAAQLFDRLGARDDRSLELAIERLDDGEVSPFFHDVAEVGDEIELSAPLGGHFIWRAADGGPILLIGGGSGVVPLMSMARHRALNGSTVPMLLLFSARTRPTCCFATNCWN